MPITIDGTGTITGLSAGGLPDASITTTELAAGAVTTAKIADANLTAAKLDGAQSGSAPIYGARAWVNFNGTGTVAIRASANITSITDNNVGNYTVNFTTAMPSTNYAVTHAAAWTTTATTSDGAFTMAPQTFAAGSVVLLAHRGTGAASDPAIVNAAIFN